MEEKLGVEEKCFEVGGILGGMLIECRGIFEWRLGVGGKSFGCLKFSNVWDFLISEMQIGGDQKKVQNFHQNGWQNATGFSVDCRLSVDYHQTAAI
jgi:hypothetical protein